MSAPRHTMAMIMAGGESKLPEASKQATHAGVRFPHRGRGAPVCNRVQAALPACAESCPAICFIIWRILKGGPPTRFIDKHRAAALRVQRYLAISK